MLAVNLALIAATPIDGGHYLTDVLGGILIAVLAIVAVRGIVQRRRAANYAASSLPS
jgi:membrane-associated phospholipid phosphatase